MMSPRSGQPRTIVVALGGNALQPPGGTGDIHEQFAHTRKSLEPLVALAREGWRIAIVHGNGPQIGDDLRRNEAASDELPPLPVGVLVAGTEGWIGYMVQQSLQNALDRFGVKRDVVTIITQVVVDPDDPLTRDPIKPIGRVIAGDAARALRDAGVPLREVAGGYRRLIASPVPIRIVEHGQIRRLVEAGTIVIAAGGGGCPVYIDPTLGLEGLDAVIDKDRAGQVLAADIDASEFVILTDVDGVYRSFGTPEQALVPAMTPAEARRMLDSGELGKGSMGPKVEAALAFVEGGGAAAHIGRLDQGLDVVEGKTGTTIRPARPGMG
ncbi:MAG TPA: carbamate kinase [Longimicrobiales bacterium]|nr:carbamate kinase [Longimicrobiales bacterium]